jgi:hypothetical protein
MVSRGHCAETTGELPALIADRRGDIIAERAGSPGFGEARQPRPTRDVAPDVGPTPACRRGDDGQDRAGGGVPAANRSPDGRTRSGRRCRTRARRIAGLDRDRERLGLPMSTPGRSRTSRVRRSRLGRAGSTDAAAAAPVADPRPRRRPRTGAAWKLAAHARRGARQVVSTSGFHGLTTSSCQSTARSEGRMLRAREADGGGKRDRARRRARRGLRADDALICLRTQVATEVTSRGGRGVGRGATVTGPPVSRMRLASMPPSRPSPADRSRPATLPRSSRARRTAPP